MKRRVFYLTVLTALITWLLLFCGCMGGSGDSIQSVFIEIINKEYTYNETENILSMDYEQRDSVELLPADFQLTLTYESGSTKILETRDYVVELSQDLQSMQPNSYHTLYFKDAVDGEEIAFIRLYIRPATLQKIVYEESMSFPYTGEEYNIIDELDKKQPIGQKTIRELIEKDALVVGDGSTTKATTYNANGYVLKLKPSNGFLWDGETDDEITISWQIDRIKILIPEFEKEIEYQYEIVNGEVVGIEQCVEPDFGEYKDYIRYSGIRVGTAPFEYRKSFWISVNERYSGRYVLYDGEQEYPTGYEVRWRIIPKNLPSVSLKKSEFVYEKPSVNALGEGNSNLLNYDSTFMKIDYKNSNTFLSEAGNGKIRIALKEEFKSLFAFEKTENEDIALGDGYVDLKYSVLKGNFNPTAEVDFSKLVIETTYSSSLTLSKLPLIKTEGSTFVAWTDASWEYLKELGCVTDDTNGGFAFNFLKNENEVLKADEYPDVELLYHHYGENYEPYPLKVNVFVNKLTIDLDFSNGISAQLTDGKCVYSASAAPVVMSDGLLSVLKYAQEECGAKIECCLEYVKEKENEPIRYFGSIDEYATDYFSAYTINAGEYKLKVNVECDDNHLVGIDGGEATKQGVATFEFAVEKFVTDVRLVEVGNSLSENNAFYEENDDSFYYKQGRSVSLILTAWEEENVATNALLAQLKKSAEYASATTLAKAVSGQTTYYRSANEEEWSLAADTTNVGYYKTVFSFEPINGNIQLNDAAFEWRIYSNEIVFDSYDLTWEGKVYNTYKAKAYTGPKIVNLPENVLKTEYNHYQYGEVAGDSLSAVKVGHYETNCSIILPAADEFTFSYPVGMFTERETGEFKIYTTVSTSDWFINEYYISNYDFEIKLEKNLFVWDDTDKTVKIKVDTYIENEFCLEMKAFLEKAVIIRDETAKVVGKYTAKIQFPSGSGGENFDFNYESFNGVEGYSYDSATKTLTVEIPWSIVRS